MIIDLQGKTKLQYFQDLYNEARAAAEELYQNLEKYYKQYRGDKNIDDSDVPATVVRNITYELIESQVTTYLPNPAVTPKTWSEKNERNAKSAETLLSNKRNELPFEKMNDIDERYNPIYGGSVWLIEWDNSITTHNTVGDVKVSCLNPQKFTGQPSIFDVKEMEYCFIEFNTTKDDIVRKYGVSPEIADETESDEDADDKTATLYVCYYKNDDGKVCQFVWSGDTELLDLVDYYARKRKVCKKCGKRKELCSCEKPKFELLNEEYEELDRDIHLSNGDIIPAMSEVIKDGKVVTETQKTQAVLDDGTVALEEVGGVMLPIMVDKEVPKLEPTRLPFYTPNILPIVIRKNTSEQDNLLGQSDCEFIRPQQQAINKIESRIMEKLMGGGVFPIVPEGVSVDIDNSLFKKVFRQKQADKGLYGTLDLRVDVSTDIAAAERLYAHAKRILGITDSYQGQYDASAQSGKAKQIQVNQAAGRLDSKRQMKNAAYAEIDQIIFQYYLAYADEPRPATFKDSEGRTQNYFFNRYDFIERDEAGEWYYNDAYLFSADATIDVEKSRELIWEQNRLNFQQGAYGDPALLQTKLVFWQVMERTHYPFARDTVERIRAEIERQAEIQQYQQQVAQLTEEVQNRQGYADYLLGELNKRNASGTNGGNQ